MPSWLLLAAALQAAPIAGLGPDMRGLAPEEVSHLARTHALDLRLKQDSTPFAQMPLIRGVILQREVAPNAAVGLGLSNLYDRRKSGFDNGAGVRPRHSRKPAVSFVLKF